MHCVFCARPPACSVWCKGESTHRVPTAMHRALCLLLLKLFFALVHAQHRQAYARPLHCVFCALPCLLIWCEGRKQYPYPCLP